MVCARYHQVCYVGTEVRLRDREVLRRVTLCMQGDKGVRDQFLVLPSPAEFHADDVERVYLAYLGRVETMMGNEVGWKLMDQLRLRKVDKLGALRQYKRDRDEELKGMGVDTSGVSGDSVVSSTGKKNKKRKRRKRKNW